MKNHCSVFFCNNTLCFQLYWLFITISHANLLDVLFCCCVIFACEQLKHLKDILKPLMELSAALDSVVPNSADLFRAASSSANQFNTMKGGKSENSNYINYICKHIEPVSI